MSENKIMHSFIREWLEQKKSEPEFDQSVVESIEHSLGGVNNETLDETSLLKALIEIVNGLDKNV